MGAVYLTDLADVLAAAGCNVVELDGWQTRARSSGGYDTAPWLVMFHHTASAGNGAQDADYCTFGDEDAPLCNVVVGGDGTVYLCAAGATNTNGKGGPLALPDGRVVPVDGCNSRAFGIEISNNGVGMAYPVEQIDACFAVSTAVTAAYIDGHHDNVGTHQAWAPDRKIDPATADAVTGPWCPDPVTSSGSWSLDDLRAECVRRSTTIDEGFLMALTDEQQADLYDRIMGSLPGEYSNDVRGPGPTGARTFTLDDQDGNHIVALLEQILDKLGDRHG